LTLCIWSRWGRDQGAGEEATSKFPKVGAAELAAEDIKSKGGFDVGDKKYNVEVLAYDDGACRSCRWRRTPALP
jgi:hypothetical protein